MVVSVEAIAVAIVSSIASFVIGVGVITVASVPSGVSSLTEPVVVSFLNSFVFSLPNPCVAPYTVVPKAKPTIPAIPSSLVEYSN